MERRLRASNAGSGLNTGSSGRTPRSQVEIDGILSGMTGYKLRRLLVPMIELKAHRNHIKSLIRLRQKSVASSSTPEFVSLAMKSPLLNKLGEAGLRDLLSRGKYRYFEAGETVFYKDEPPSVTGAILIVSGSVLHVSKPTYRGGVLGGGGGGEPSSGRQRRGSVGISSNTPSSVSSAVVRAGVEELAPAFIGGDRLFTEEPHTHHVIAHTSLDAFIVPLAELHATLQSLPESAQQSLAKVCRPLRQSVVSREFPLTELMVKHTWLTVGLDRHAVQTLLSRMTPACFFPGATICAKGTPTEAIYFLRRGTVKVTRASAQQLVSPSTSRRRTTLTSSALFGSPLSPASGPSVTPTPSIAAFSGGAAGSPAVAIRTDSHLTAVRPSIVPSEGNTPLVPSLSIQQPSGSICEPQSPLVAASGVKSVSEEQPLVSFGEMGMVFGERCASTITAETICDCWALPKAEYEQFLSTLTGSRAIINQTAVILRSRWLGAQKESTTVRTIRDALRSIPYLTSAPREALSDLVALSKPKVYTMYTSIISASEWSDSLILIARGTALSQQRSKGKKERFGVGNALGVTCVVEHRSIIPVCALTMVDVWEIKRSDLLDVLHHYGRKQEAIAFARARIDEEYRELGEPMPAQLGRPVDIAEEKKVPAMKSVFTPRVIHHTDSSVSPIQQKSNRMETSMSPSREGSAAAAAGGGGDGAGTNTQPASPAAPTSPQRQRASSSPRRSRRTVHGSQDGEEMFNPEQFSIDVGDPDINHGQHKLRALFSELCYIPTRRHSIVATVRELTGLPRYPYRAVGSPSLDTTNRSVSPGRSPSPQLGSILKHTFAPSSPGETSMNGGLAENKPKAARMIHKQPYTYMAVEATERLGLNAPWMLLLLGRKCALEGFLEGSTPVEGTMEDYGQYWTRVKAEQRAALARSGNSALESSVIYHHARVTTPPGEKPEVNALKNPYKPLHPHGYGVVLPPSISKARGSPPSKSKSPESRASAREHWSLAARVGRGSAKKKEDRTQQLEPQPSATTRRWTMGSGEGLVDQILLKNMGTDFTVTDDPDGPIHDFFEEEWERMLHPVPPKKKPTPYRKQSLTRERIATPEALQDLEGSGSGSAGVGRRLSRLRSMGSMRFVRRRSYVGEGLHNHPPTRHNTLTPTESEGCVSVEEWNDTHFDLDRSLNESQRRHSTTAGPVNEKEGQKEATTPRGQTLGSTNGTGGSNRGRGGASTSREARTTAGSGRKPQVTSSGRKNRSRSRRTEDGSSHYPASDTVPRLPPLGSPHRTWHGIPVYVPKSSA